MSKHALLLLPLVVALVAPAEAAVLCQKRSGTVVVRAGCRKHETPLDPDALGLRGPAGAAGSARAYACANASADGTLVTACSARPSKNVTSVVANSMDSSTCFVLDPSIDADSAVVVASFNENVSFGTEVNVIIWAFGARTWHGCPANSVVVQTARYSASGSGFLQYDLVRLPVNVAVM